MRTRVSSKNHSKLFYPQLNRSLHGSVSNAKFEIMAEPCAATTCRALSGFSTGNSMTPTRIDFGLELYGTAGGVAPQTIFTSKMLQRSL